MITVLRAGGKRRLLRNGNETRNKIIKLAGTAKRTGNWLQEDLLRETEPAY